MWLRSGGTLGVEQRAKYQRLVMEWATAPRESVERRLAGAGLLTAPAAPGSALTGRASSARPPSAPRRRVVPPVGPPCSPAPSGSMRVATPAPPELPATISSPGAIFRRSTSAALLKDRARLWAVADADAPGFFF